MIDKNDIQLDDLNPDFREIAEAIGLEQALKLAEVVGGGPVYIPSVENIFRESRNRAIRAAFNGRNYRELARRYRLSISWIRTIVNGSREHSQAELVDRQMKLF